MRERLKVHVTIEALLGVVSLILAILSVIGGDWIEELTGLDPDARSGALEWAIVFAFVVAAVALGSLATRDGMLLREGTFGARSTERASDSAGSEIVGARPER